MGTGYIRNDTGDNIADGNVINASDLDGEFDALQSAFDNSTGHTHDGTAAEGAPIEKVGPNQEVVVTATVLRPAANNTIDLGVETTNEFKNLYIDGTAYLDSVDIDGGTIDGLSVLTVDNLSLNGNTITSTDTNGNLNLRANGTGIISVDATDVNFGDSDKATFGDGSDLQIYHDGSNSYIRENSTGDLLIQASNIQLEDPDGNNYLRGVDGGILQLYHNGTEVMQTASTGISVTGDVDASDDLILSSDSSKILFGANGDMQLIHNHNAGLILENNNTGDGNSFVLTLQSNEDTLTVGEQIARINFSTDPVAGGVSAGTQASIRVEATDTYSATVSGSSMEFWTTDSAGTNRRALYIDDDQSIHFTGSTNVVLDATNDTLDFPDNFKIMMGASDDLQIFHNGTSSIIQDTGTGGLTLRSNLLSLQNAAGTETLASFVEDGSVTLRHDNVTKLSTASTGVNITGAFTATDGSIITVDDNSVALNLISTDTDATQGPILRLTRDAVGAASDVIGTIHYYGEDVGGNGTQYAEIEGRIEDATDGAEDGTLVLSTMVAGTSRSRLNFYSTEAVFNEGSQDSDFRVESSGNQKMLFVDGGNNRVGVGTNTPAADFHVNSGAENFTGLFESTDEGARITLIDNGTTGGSAAQHGLNTVGDQLEIRAVDNLSFETGGAGAERMRIDSSGRVGIGTSSPATDLSVSSTGADAKIFAARQVASGNLSNTAAGGSIEFGSVDSSTYAEYSGAAIKLHADQNWTAGSAQGSALAFSVTADGTATLSEAMRIDSSGNLLVGTTNSTPGIGDTDDGAVLGAAGWGFFSKTYSSADSSSVLYVGRNGTDGNIINIAKDGSTVGSIGNSGGSMYISAASTGGLKYTYLNGTNAVTQPCNTVGATTNGTHDLGTSGASFRDLYLSGGVYLGGTGSANKLDDYEEGTWVVNMYDAASGGNVSTTEVTGRYVKIGQQVIASFDAFNNVDTSGLTAGNPVYFTLPFAASSTGRSCGACHLDNVTFAAAGTMVTSSVSDSASRSQLSASGSNTEDVAIKAQNFNGTSSDVVNWTLSYRTT